MVVLKNALVVLVASLGAIAQAHDAKHGGDNKLSISMSNSIISRAQGVLAGEGDRSAILQAGFMQKAFHQLVKAYPNDTSTPFINAYITKSVDSVAKLVSNATLDTTAYPLDRLSSGNGLIYQYETTGNETYRIAFEGLRKSIDLQPRNAEGGLWYWIYPHWSYLDGMYSFAPFLTSYTSRYSAANTTAVLDLLFQLDLLWQHCHNETSGLLVHGYDASKTAMWANNVTGASPHVWGRSLGWYSMALIDTLELLPKTPVFHEARRYVRERFQHLSAAVVKAVDAKSGGWWQILDQPGKEGNYIESSGTSMFIYSLLKGVRMGVLNDKHAQGYHAHGAGAHNTSYTDVAVHAYEYVSKKFIVDNGNGTLGWNGTVGVCSLNSTATYEVSYPGISPS